MDHLDDLAEFNRGTIDKTMVRRAYGETPDHGASSLCASCSRSTIVKGQSLNEEIVRCHSAECLITFTVTRCNAYLDKSLTPLHEMKEIAWELRTDKAGKKIGFLSPQEAAALKKEAKDHD